MMASGSVRRALPAIVAIAATAALALPGSAMAAAPANDDVQNAQVITGGFANTNFEASVPGTNVEATAQAGEPHGKDSMGSDRSTVWYSWTAPYGGEGHAFGIALCDAEFHMVLGRYTKDADPVPPFSNLTDLGALGDETPTGCPFSVTYFGAYDHFSLTPDHAGQTYYFQIAGRSASSDTGPFTLTLEQFGPGVQFQVGGDQAPAIPPTTPAVKKCKHKRSASAAKKKKCKKKRKK